MTFFTRVEAVIHRAISNNKLCDITADGTARFIRSAIESEYAGERE